MFELLCYNLLLVKETKTYLSLSNFNTASVSSSLQSLPLDMPSADDECFDLLKLLPPCSPAEEVLFFKLLLCMWFFRPTELRSQRDCAEALPSNISLTNLACSAARIWRLCATSFLQQTFQRIYYFFNSYSGSFLDVFSETISNSELAKTWVFWKIPWVFRKISEFFVKYLDFLWEFLEFIKKWKVIFKIPWI